MYIYQSYSCHHCVCKYTQFGGRTSKLPFSLYRKLIVNLRSQQGVRCRKSRLSCLSFTTSLYTYIHIHLYTLAQFHWCMYRLLVLRTITRWENEPSSNIEITLKVKWSLFSCPSYHLSITHSRLTTFAKTNQFHRHAHTYIIFVYYNNPKIGR